MRIQRPSLLSFRCVRIPFCAIAILTVAFTDFGGTVAALDIVAVTSDNGLPARSVRWTDAAGKIRTAIMVDQRVAGAGYLRQFTYQVNGVDRVCRGTGANGHQGNGYVQNHTAYGGDSSSHRTPGSTTVLLAGSHHAILSYDMPGYKIGNQSIPTTVHWFFADGRSHPIFSISQDARSTSANLGADSRSPYGDVAYDGGVNATVGGASFGDTFKFVTLAANPEQVTRASGWRYTEPNTIPYAMQWTDPAQVDAEMGHVATLPITVKDQGSDPRTYPVVDVRGTQQLNGPMINDENWAYQILNYVLPAQGPSGSKRLTWGTNWGLPGGFDNYGDTTLNKRHYSQHATSVNGAYNGTRADGMLMAYSVFVVLGTHSGGYSAGTVGQAVKQMENAALARLTTSVGTIKTSGPSGVGNASSVMVNYRPAGYNPVFSTWEVIASGNAVNATLTPVSGKPLDHPVFVINGYSLGQVPASISVGNGLTRANIDYFATLDATNQRLWITVNRVATSAVNLQVTPTVPSSLVLYNDAVANGWLDYSWATVNSSNTNPVHSGSKSFSVTAGAWEALYLYHSPINVSSYKNFSFWIHLGTSAPPSGSLQVQAVLDNGTESGVPQTPVILTAAMLPADLLSWKQVSIPLATLGIGSTSKIIGFYIKNETDTLLPIFYVDDISLTP
ncbi:MAG TPA: hypothetical protein VIT21_13320 [Chthoniobacterales bacterium]